MSNTDNIDSFGHCVVCHKNLLTKKVVGDKVVDMFLPIYNETFFLLNTGSQMQVTICTPCKSSIDLSDDKIHNNIMEAVYKGWELETKLKVDSKEMKKEDRDDYIDTIKNWNINCHSECLDKYVIQQKQIELRNIEVKDINVTMDEVKDGTR